MKKIFKYVTISLIVLLLFASPAAAASSTKTFSSNYTLVNLGTETASVTASYVAPDGSEWGDSIFKTFSIPAGANQIVRQYNDTGLTPGQGSVVIASSQPLGALVQEIVRTGTPTSGAYAGIDTPSATWYIPMAARKASSGTGMANSQIVIQNVGAAAVDFDVELYAFGAAIPTYTKNFTGLAAGASVVYDLEGETNLPEAWWGSAVVSTTSGSLGVISHLFFGADSLMAFNGFPTESIYSSWFIPLLYVRLSNSLTTSLSIQNLSGEEIPVNDLTLACTKNASAPGAPTITLHNTTAIANNGAYTFNTLTDKVSFPDAGWYGSCKVESATGKGIVTLIMYRYTANAEQAAYGAVPGNLSSTNVSVPLVAKRLSNGYANTVTVQNLSAADATVTLTYTPTGGGDPIVRPGIVIPAGESLIRNFRLTGTELPEITDGWVGSLSVTSDQPIAAYVSNTYLSPTGDQFMAYLGFNH
jgi:hypothetical protein